MGEFLGKVRYIRNSTDYDKNIDYKFFDEELKNIHQEIENIVNSINYLRNNPWVV